MGSIQNSLNNASLSILYLASSISKYRSKLNEEGKNRAKKSYSTAATIKKQNNEITKNLSEPPKPYIDSDYPLPPEKDEQKIAEQKVLEQMAQGRAKATNFGGLATTKEELPVESKVVEKKAPQHFGEIPSVEETFKQANAPTEKEVVEAKKPVQRLGELAGIEETPATEQKYISSEESAYSPIKAENTETKIPVDEDVQGLIKVKQKNALRAASGKRSQERYQNIKEKLTYRFADEHNIDDV